MPNFILSFMEFITKLLLASIIFASYKITLIIYNILRDLIAQKRVTLNSENSLFFILFGLVASIGFYNLPFAQFVYTLIVGTALASFTILVVKIFEYQLSKRK